MENVAVLQLVIYIYIPNEEIEKTGVYFGLSRAWFKRCYLLRPPEKGWVLALSDAETSVFPGEDRRCEQIGQSKVVLKKKIATLPERQENSEEC